MKSDQLRSFITKTTAFAIFACIGTSWAQTATEHPDQSGPSAGEADFARHLDQLTNQLDNMRRQLQDSQKEMDELRNELRGLRDQLAEKSESAKASQDQGALTSSVEKLREDTDVLQAEVKQHDQIKVETASKFPVRISGTILFTSALNSGTPDNIDLPIVALPNTPNSPHGSLSATPRQTLLGLDASGPRLWSAKSSADISIDFFAGIPYADYTTAAGFVRLRTAHARLDWTDRNLALAFDRPLVSPWQPTSWLTVGEPALAWAGNLWTWTPQIQFTERAILPSRKLTLALGLMDPAAPGVPQVNGLRTPDASESSKQPGYEARTEYDWSPHEHPVHLGAGGYYSRQSYTYDRHVDAWAGTADWSIALAHPVGLSGEFYRGRAIGGLGGGAFKDYVTYNNYALLRGLNDEGGWAQLKIVFSPTLEANLAFGQDNAFASDLRNSDLATEQNEYATLARNQDALGNLVYRPRAYLLLSAEFRQIHSWPIAAQGNTNRVFGLAAGYSF
jgi:regulator of replication initiation timing